MRELTTPAVLDQQVPADEIGQAGAMFRPIVSIHGSAWGKLGVCEEITELLEGGTVLQGHAHQTGDLLVEVDDLWSTVSSFHTKEEFRWGRIIVDRNVGRTLVGDANLVGDRVATIGEGNTLAHV